MRRDGESVSERGVSIPNELINREPGEGGREREREREKRNQKFLYIVIWP